MGKKYEESLFYIILSGVSAWVVSSFVKIKDES